MRGKRTLLTVVITLVLPVGYCLRSRGDNVSPRRRRFNSDLNKLFGVVKKECRR